MIANLGYSALVISFVTALYGVGAALYGSRKKQPALIESGRLALMLVFPLVSLAVASLLFLLATGHYEVAYVFSVTSSTAPLYLRLTALWGGQDGSLLFWSWLMSAFAMAVSLRKWDRDREFLPWVTVVVLTTLAFFLFLSIFTQNPFLRFFVAPDGTTVVSMNQPAGMQLLYPPDGRGLNPLLRHPGMIFHPPLLYLGFVSFVIPFAFAVAALVTGRSDDRWIRITRRWTLVGWLFLSFGLVLGMRWAYDVLGWGGYWGWDPVEIAALMPWLTGTAFLHSVMMQEKRGLFKRWNMVLIILTYALMIFGTFLTRSGVLSSVHAFARSDIGPLFFVYIAITSLLCLGLLVWRWNTLKSEVELTALLSRESFFLLNNLFFMGILIVCFVGVVFPIFSELITGVQVTMGAPYYKTATGPLFAALLLLMGIVPLTAWGRSTYKTLRKTIWKPLTLSLLVPVVLVAAGMRSWGALLALWLVSFTAFVTLYDYGRSVGARMHAAHEGPLVAFWRLGGKNRRRFGGYIIHLGVVLMAVGIIGMEFFQTQTQGTLKRGESLQLGSYSLTLTDIKAFDTGDGRNVVRAEISAEKGDSLLGMLYPRRDLYSTEQQTMTVPAIYSTLEGDLYVVLADWEQLTADSATFKVYYNPLINWLWIGALVFCVGTLVAVWPDPLRKETVGE